MDTRVRELVALADDRCLQVFDHCLREAMQQALGHFAETLPEKLKNVPAPVKWLMR